jgi:rhodanese-related sulfurtransferase
LPPIDAYALQTLLAEGGIALDVRSGEEFAGGHVPGSVNIPLSGQFASWAGALLGLESRPVLIAASDEAVTEARMRLARVGLENVQGYLKGGVAAWKESAQGLETIPRITVQALNEQLNQLQVLDVRREPEWETGHVEGAMWWPLDNFKIAPPEIDRDVTVAVHCKGGYRSMIACSLLQRAGFKNIVDVTGGFDAWQQAKLAVTIEKPVVA